MECLKCGKINNDNAKHCTSCGKRLVNRLYVRDAWEKNLRRTRRALVVSYFVIFLGAILVFSASVSGEAIAGLMLVVIAAIYTGNCSHLGAALKWWKKRVARSEDSAREYAAMVDWESDSIGLEPTSKIEFRRKTDKSIS